VALTLLLVGTSAVSAAEWEGFTDVTEEDTHYEAIKALTEQEILNGYPDGTFDQWSNIERQHVAHILFKVEDFEVPSNIDEVLDNYSDVSSKSEYGEEIAALTEAGVFKGDDGKFRPDDPITREQIASVLVKALDLDEVNAEEIEINLSNVDPSHQEFVQILANLELTNQLDDYRPAEQITRAASASLIYRAMQVDLTFDLSIMHMNDTHARADQLPKVVTAVNEVRTDKPDSL